MKRFLDGVRLWIGRNARILLYTACVFGLCLVNVWRVNGNGAQWSLAINCTGFLVFPMIVCRYRLQDFRRPVYPIWLIFFAIAAIPIYRRVAPGTDYNGKYLSAILNIGLYGLLAIRVYDQLFCGNQYENGTDAEQGRPRRRIEGWGLTGFFWLWLALMVCCIVSINRAVWPLWFFVMFGAYYLAPLDGRELRELTDGLVYGLIAGFFYIQCKAFLYRPFDDPRYYGYFSNSNQNAYFYMISYLAFLALYTKLRRGGGFGRGVRVLRAAAFLLACSQWVFAFFTNGRSGILGMAFAALTFWILEEVWFRGNGLRGLLRQCLLMLLGALLCFLPVYGCIRYIPALRHHPVWFGGEYSEQRVHSFDPVNSEKYTSLSDVFKMWIWHTGHTTEVSRDVFLQSNAAFPGILTVYTGDVGFVPGEDSDHPIYTDPTYDGLGRYLGVRKYIYRYLFQNLTFRGHEEIYIDVWVLRWMRLLHAHNSFLQIAYLFGILPGILFLVIPVFALVRICRGARRYRRRAQSAEGELDAGEPSEVLEPEAEYEMLLSASFYAAYIGAGLFECLALTGELAFALYFLLLLPLVRREKTGGRGGRKALKEPELPEILAGEAQG